MIGGIIVLSLLLVGLGAMVFVSQQNDQYQQSVEGMMQRNNQQSSESLVFNFPGLTLLTSSAVPGWGSGCTSTYNCYNMTVSDLGGVGVQVVRIYINSTGSGCTSLCVLNPISTITNYGFNQANSFLNAGEVNHWLILALPISVALPNSPFSKNTILVVTSRGNVFSFQWPFQNLVGGQSQSAFSAGIMKVAYQYSQSAKYGYDSMNEWGPVAAGSGGTVTSEYCHHEPEQPYQAPATDAEKLAMNSTDQTWGVRGGVLWFVNPWVSQDIINNAETNGPKGQVNGHPTWPSNLTTLYIYVNFTNVGSIPFAISAGSMDLTWYSFNWIDANLIGYYQGAPPGAFYPAGSTHTVAPGASFYAIFKVVDVCLGRSSCKVDDSTTGTWPPPNDESVMFEGSASLTSNTGDTTFVAGVALLPGLWIRSSCP
jgi:hypothetical protein